MDKEEHKERHVELHKAFDELVADYLLHHLGKLLSETTLLDLAEWSYAQTISPTEKEE